MWIAPTSSSSSACVSRTWSGSASRKSRKTDSGSTGIRQEPHCCGSFVFLIKVITFYSLQFLNIPIRYRCSYHLRIAFFTFTINYHISAIVFSHSTKFVFRFLSIPIGSTTNAYFTIWNVLFMSFIIS